MEDKLQDHQNSGLIWVWVGLVFMFVLYVVIKAWFSR